MNDGNNMACCAHLRLKRVHTYWFGGMESDHWECESCNVRFVPDMGPQQRLRDPAPSADVPKRNNE